MKLKFKVQEYQTHAVHSVVDCFDGQPMARGMSYRIDPGSKVQNSMFEDGVKNAEIALSEAQILANVQTVQRRQNLTVSKNLTDFSAANAKGEQTPAPAAYISAARAASHYHLDVEMETGTGKTYCYIKTLFEMNKRFGWSKFIIMVPSIAIREGVYKSLQITAEHFAENYGKKARFFIYNSKRLHELESFASDAGINVMVINIQAFAARGADNRRIYDELDDFQSRRPIDVIASTRPILILDEPQKMGGKATMEALPKFKPLMILRYSATHKTQHNLVHRLDAVDAYNQKLVKKIAVRGVQTRGLAGTNGYLYLEGINISTKAPIARVDMEVKLKSGEIKRQVRRLKFRDDLFVLSGELDQYRGFIVSQINYNHDTVEFSNGVVLTAGEAVGDVSEHDMRRIQIRETIKAHLDKEKQLFAQKIKVLSLFFIDEVVKYRDYSQPDEKGEYARIFEEEYALLKQECLSEKLFGDEAYRAYLAGIDVEKTHKGYFSIDKKSKHLTDPTGVRAVDSDDVDAYDLILKDKESLLTLPTPSDSVEQRAKREVRFIFSHSALREGWDNPNVFAMCMLKHSNNMTSRHQEVGRGLRLCVDQHGDRVDNPEIVHDTNVLTVVASESYKDFVRELQEEIAETLSARPRQANEAYFKGKTMLTKDGDTMQVTQEMARDIFRYLLVNKYIDSADYISEDYCKAKEAGNLSALPEELAPYSDQILQLIDSVFIDAQLPKIDDGRRQKTNPLNDNFHKGAFQELWSRINRKAVYQVDFDSKELICNCIKALDKQLHVTPLQYIVTAGVQTNELTYDQLKVSEGFESPTTSTELGGSVYSQVKYDLVGKVAQNSKITRGSSAKILSSLEFGVFAQFQKNPEHFIAEASRIITEQKAAMVIERLSYDEIAERYSVDIFTANQSDQNFLHASSKLKKHVYDYVVTDSKIEKEFAKDLENSTEVVVYAKLPRGFCIPTPVGDYNPDWAISFKEGDIKHIYFVAETKGSMSTMKLREVERAKIKCAEKFFEEISQKTLQDKVKYAVVTDYAKLMDIVKC